MPKSKAQRVREAEAAHRARGERQIRVWVPDIPEAIDQVRRQAAQLCSQHARERELRNLISEAIERYRVRVLDNIDPQRLTNDFDRARVIARALMERGDANAFRLGRKMLAIAEPR